MVGRASPRSLPIRLLTSPHDAIISNRWRSPQANFNTRCDGTPPNRRSLFAELFRARCAIQVREAEDKELIEPGVAYFAPPDYHLLVEADRRLSLSGEEPVLYSRPSIDVLFESAADAYSGGLVGVVLTGANSDGADGLKAVVEAGGVAIVQSPKGAYAAAMPEAAIASCPEALVLSLNEIAVYLREIGAR